MRPRWSRPTDEVAFETLRVPEERMTLGQKWTHNKRVKEAAMKAERKDILEKTRRQFRHSSEGRSETQKEKVQRMRRIRLAQMTTRKEDTRRDIPLCNDDTRRSYR